MSRRGRISLDHLHCYKDGEIRSAEPYLLTAFFKIDGEGNFIDVKDGQFFIGGSCTFRATPGSHGNLGTRHVSNGDDVSIPPPIGESTFAIEPITAAGIGLPDTKISGFVGVVVALMEENWLTESAANAGHVAFNRTLVRKINEIVPTLRQGMTQIPPGDIELVKKELEARVKAAVIDKETDGDFFGLLNADVLIGADLFVAGKSRDIRARLQRTQTVQPPTPPQTIVTHDYMLFGRIEVNGNPVFIGPPFSIVGVGDFNGNGRADIVWHNASTHETQLWYMDNHQLVDRGTVLGLDGNPVFIGPPFSIVGVGDFNGNGRADIVWHNASTHETQLWYMDNHQLVDRGTVLGLDGNPVFIGPPFSIVGVGDFNGDGRADIVWHNASTHETQLWYMDNHQLVDRGTVLGLDGNPVFIGPPFSIVGVGDFNGNGRADIVWHNASTHETQVWYMDNHQLVDRGTVLGLDGNPVFIGPPFSIVGVGDFNGDGRADIVWHNASTHETQVWYMDNHQLVDRGTVLGLDD